MAIMIYALYTYHWRAASIRRGGRGPYDDRLGPVRISFPFVNHMVHYSTYLLSPADHTVYLVAECVASTSSRKVFRLLTFLRIV